MSLSPRKFTKEFKEAAVRRLALGVSIAEVARVPLCGMNPNVLHASADGRELRDHRAKAFSGNGRAAASKVRSANWSAR